MEKTLKFFLLIIIALIGFQTDFILAVENSVVINEIAWMGTKNSHNDEWIELYNNSYTNVNLDEWILKANDKSPEIKLSGFILSKGFYLLERTDDNSVNEVSADIIYKGALNNKGEILELFDSNENLIDKLDCHEAWFAGDNQSKQTMERSVDVKHQQAHWQTSQEPGGTPRRENSDGYSDGEVKPPQKVQPPNEPLLSGSAIASLNQGFEQVQMSKNHPEALGVNKFSTSIIALIIAFCSAVIILILKKNLKSN